MKNKQRFSTNKKIVIDKILKYTAIFDLAEEGGYVVSIPSLPGCVTQGETFEKAGRMVQDAILGYLQVLKEEGFEIPQEKEEAVFTKVAVPYPFQVAY